MRYVPGHQLTAALRKPLANRFWTKVDRKGTYDCWLWTGNLSAGYGAMKVDGRMVKAHRISYELHVGLVPAGLSVLHRCDTPACINPAHLFLGTIKDNVDDMIQKGRKAIRFGSEHNRAKLNESTVAAIRSRYASGVSGTVLAAEYGVAQTTISQIVRRRTWPHVP